MDLGPGSYEARPVPGTAVRLRTQRIGFLGVIDVEAPVVTARLDVGTDPALRVELALSNLRTGNPLMQTAARALVHSGNGDLLVFHAAALPDDPWVFDGTAKAGDVAVPMKVRVVPVEVRELLHLEVSGWARFDDVHIPLPGLGGIRTIEADVSGRIPFDAQA